MTSRGLGLSLGGLARSVACRLNFSTCQNSCDGDVQIVAFISIPINVNMYVPSQLSAPETKLDDFANQRYSQLQLLVLSPYRLAILGIQSGFNDKQKQKDSNSRRHRRSPLEPSIVL